MSNDTVNPTEETQLSNPASADTRQAEPAASNPYQDLASELIDEADAGTSDPNTQGNEVELGDEQATDEVEAMEELVLDGKTVLVPKEVKDGYLRQSDYSRKASEVAQARQAVEAQTAASQTMIKFAQVFPQVAAQVHAAEATYEQLKSTNWEALRAADPQAFNDRVAMLQLADAQRKEAYQYHAQAVAHMQQTDAHMLAVAQAQAVQELAKSDSPWAIKGFNQKVLGEIDAFWTRNGLPEDRLQRVASAMEVSILHDAMRYRQLKQQNPQAKQVGANTPAIAPQSQPVTHKGSAKGTAATANLLSTFQKNPTREGLRKLIALDL